MHTEKKKFNNFSDDEFSQLYQETNQKTGLDLLKCTNYLIEEESPEKEYYKPDWNHST